MSLKETKNDDKFYCESIAKSISEIIRFSLDEEFRKSSFKLFGVSSTKETEKEISKRLMLIIENKRRTANNTSRKRRKKETEEKDRETLEEFTGTSNTNDLIQLSSTTAEHDDSQMLPQNFSRKNWLQISSQQYRDVIKRRKLNYFSQPLLGQSCQNDIEFLNSNLHTSNSQPTSSTSGAFFNETTESSNSLSNEGITFCQKKFNTSFKDNAQKYFEKKLNFYKHSF